MMCKAERIESQKHFLVQNGSRGDYGSTSCPGIVDEVHPTQGRNSVGEEGGKVKTAEKPRSFES